MEVEDHKGYWLQSVTPASASERRVARIHMQSPFFAVVKEKEIYK